jgi:hypothetical protein
MGRYGLHKTKPTLSDLANVAVFVPSIKYFVGKNSSAPSQINLIDNVDGYARVRLERLGTSQKSQDGATILRVNHTFKKGDYIFAGGLIIGIK